MAGRLYRMAKVVSANPASWGIVDANQISGFRTVAKLTDLYSIAACILSSSYGDGTTTGADAVGQIWHVQENGGKDYRLKNWANRGTSAGWEEVLYADSVYSKSEIDGKINTINTSISSKADNATVTGLSTKVNGIEDTVSTHTQNITDINTRLGKKAEKDDVSTLMNTVDGITAELTDFKGTVGKNGGLAQLDSKGFVPLNQLGNLDMTVFTVVSVLPTSNIENKVYLLSNGTSGDNKYEEYIYTGDRSGTYDATKWERLGSVKASVDMTNYYTKNQIDTKVTAINKNSISSLSIDKQDSTDAVSVVLKRAGGENTLSAPIPVVNNTSDNHHNGLMSPAMLTKLNGIANGANNYVHPNSSAGAKEIGLYKIATDAQGHVTAATAVTKYDLEDAELIPEMSVNAINKTATENELSIIYNEVQYITTFATATSKKAGLLSADLFNKLSGLYSTPLANTVTADDITHAVTGKAISTAINNHIVNNNNLESATTGDYHIIGQSDSTNNAAALVDSLKYYYDATDHSTLRIDGAAVWDESTLRAISNDELTEILI